jgi:CsoR family transcriptional regulator, copper-sensing transcriptional repressor
MTDQPSAEQIQARLHRIDGQIRGIGEVCGDDRACEDVVTQLMAVRSSIDTVGALILDEHLCQCIDGSEDPVQQIRESMRLWWRFAPAAGGTGALANEVGAQSPLPAD